MRNCCNFVAKVEAVATPTQRIAAIFNLDEAMCLINKNCMQCATKIAPSK
jgi:hypothetical protein